MVSHRKSRLSRGRKGSPVPSAWLVLINISASFSSDLRERDLAQRRSGSRQLLLQHAQQNTAELAELLRITSQANLFSRKDV